MFQSIINLSIFHKITNKIMLITLVLSLIVYLNNNVNNNF